MCHGGMGHQVGPVDRNIVAALTCVGVNGHFTSEKNEISINYLTVLFLGSFLSSLSKERSL